MDAQEKLTAIPEGGHSRANPETLPALQRFNLAGHMAGAIAHDFNNILTGVLGNLELMQRRADRLGIADFNDYLKGGRSAAARGVAFAQNLLAIAGLQPLDPKAVDLSSFAANSLDQITAYAGDTVLVSVDCATGLPGIVCDETKLEEAVLEFCRHGMLPPAARHMSLSINRRELTDDATEFDLVPGHYAVVSLQHDGPGMSDEEAAHAFEPFHATNADYGLGLAKALGFARQSGGHAFIAGHQPGAMKFTIMLPAAS